MKRDCQCPRVRHVHGTNAAYHRCGCRCDECRAASAAVEKLRYKLTAYGRWAPFVPAIGPARRLQALACLGWSLDALAERLGVTDTMVVHWQQMHYQKMTKDTAARISALYDELWDQRAPGKYTLKTINRAERMGWVPPLAWDDDEIDDPDATPHLDDGPRELRPCGTLAAYRRHIRRDEKPCELCSVANRLGEDVAA